MNDNSIKQEINVQWYKPKLIKSHCPACRSKTNDHFNGEKNCFRLARQHHFGGTKQWVGFFLFLRHHFRKWICFFLLVYFLSLVSCQKLIFIEEKKDHSRPTLLMSSGLHIAVVQPHTGTHTHTHWANWSSNQTVNGNDQVNGKLNRSEISKNSLPTLPPPKKKWLKFSMDTIDTNIHLENNYPPIFPPKKKISLMILKIYVNNFHGNYESQKKIKQ